MAKKATHQIAEPADAPAPHAYYVDIVRHTRPPHAPTVVARQIISRYWFSDFDHASGFRDYLLQTQAGGEFVSAITCVNGPASTSGIPEAQYIV